VIEPDASLVARIALNEDREALAELDLRHAKTLYAVAYAVLLDADAAAATVEATFGEVERAARGFDAGRQSAHQWLVELARRIAAERLTPSGARPRAPARDQGARQSGSRSLPQGRLREQVALDRHVEGDG